MTDPAYPKPRSPRELQDVIRTEREGAPFLICRDAEGEQLLVRLNPADRELTLGRRSTNDIALDWDPEISRTHAELRSVGDDWVIEDDGLSQNGTYVDGERVSGRRRLHDGATLRVGHTLIVYRNPVEGSASLTAAGASPGISAELTETQRRVLVALCRPFAETTGFATPATNQTIANEVHLGVDAVKGHLRVLFKKLGIGDLPQNQKRTALVERALSEGLVTEKEFRSS